MNQKPQAVNSADNRSKGRRLRVAALLLTAGAVLGTVAVVAGLDPKLPPYSGD
jgi:hypothetical protein